MQQNGRRLVPLPPHIQTFIDQLSRFPLDPEGFTNLGSLILRIRSAREKIARHEEDIRGWEAEILVLLKEGETSGSSSRITPADGGTPSSLPPAKRRMLEAFPVDGSPIGVEDLTRATDERGSTDTQAKDRARNHIDALIEAGLVERRGRGLYARKVPGAEDGGGSQTS